MNLYLEKNTHWLAYSWDYISNYTCFGE